MKRPQVSVFIATSLDGYIARSDGGIDWLKIVERPNEDYGFQRFYDTVDTLLMGRKTYETALGFDPWPYAGKRLVVLTRSTFEAKHGAEPFSGDHGALLDRLGREGAKRVYLDGGVVIGQFLREGLVDDLVVSIIPMMLGEGLPLAPGSGDVPLDLVEHRTFPSGLVQLVYRKRAV